MSTVFLRKGCQLLPGLADIGQCLERPEAEFSVALQPLLESETLGLARQGGLLPRCDLNALNVDRMLKKTSEKQSHWLIYAGCHTWKKLYHEQPGGPDTGLFMGLATINCDDDKEGYCFASADRQTVVDTMLRETKPLSGLILLNSTTCSHLARQLQITGPNAAFSPHTDAGAAALSEAFYNILSGRCRRALCGAGSQKITPWYFLEYENLLKPFAALSWFPSEAAAFVGVDSRGSAADGVLLDVMRSSVYGEGYGLLTGMDRLLSRLEAGNIAFPRQVIHAGTLGYSDTLRAETQRYLPGVKQIFIDALVGYTGPAGALLAVNLALDIVQRGLTVEQRERGRSIARSAQDSVLIIARGLEGQVNYLLVGKVP